MIFTLDNEFDNQIPIETDEKLLTSKGLLELQKFKDLNYIDVINGYTTPII